MVKVTLAESAGVTAQTLPIDLNVGAHLLQGIGETKALLINRLVNNREPLSLGEGNHQRLLPVRHKTRVDVGLDYNRLQLATRVIKPDPVIADLQLTADLAIDVQEGHHFDLLGSAHIDIATGGECGGGPAGRFVAIKDCPVGIALERLHPFNSNHPVGIDGDDCAHLLQDGDQVDDLRLDGCARQLSFALGDGGR